MKKLFARGKSKSKGMTSRGKSKDSIENTEDKSERKSSIFSKMTKGVKEGGVFLADKTKIQGQAVAKALGAEDGDNCAGARRYPTLSFVEQRIVVLDDGEESKVVSSPQELAPPKEETDECHACKEPFSLTLYRYFCSHCSKNFCHEHSNFPGKVPKFGIMQSTRLCKPCYQQLLEEGEQERIDWRQHRTDDFLKNRILPYFDPASDTLLDKGSRLLVGTVDVVRKSPIGGTIGLAADVLHASTYLKNVGLAGLAGLILKDDVVEAVGLLGQIMDGLLVTKHKDVPKAAAACYYHMAEMRAVRGNDPNGEHEMHANCPSIGDEDLSELLRLGQLPLKFVYEEDPMQMELHAKHQGWTLIYASMNSMIEHPVFAIFANKQTSECALVVRGTKSLMDCVTDARQTHVVFPSEEWKSQHPDAEGGISSNASFNCHGGMSRASEWIFNETYRTVQSLHQNGYKVLVMGHSLGAACAVLASVLLRRLLGEDQVQTYAFCTPSCGEAALAEAVEHSTISVVMRDDIIPRVSPISMRQALMEVLSNKEVYEEYLTEDLEAVKERARGVWAPKVRQAPGQQAKASSTNEEDIQKEIQESLNVDGADNEPQDFNEVEVMSAQINSPQIFIPGRIVHIYSHRGQYKACWVPKDFPDIRRLNLQDNMLDDHRSGNVMQALVQVRDVRNARQEPPQWVSFTETELCMVCDNSFTWNSTSSSQAQAKRDKFTCKRCGSLICKECSLNRKAIPSIGLQTPQRICDKCFHDVTAVW